MRSNRLIRLASIAALVLFIGSIGSLPAAASTAWVKGEIRLNLRSGAGTEFKILGAVETGDEVQVLSTQSKWTRVQTADGKMGWIPAGYLENEPPPTLRLLQVETEAATLRTQLDRRLMRSTHRRGGRTRCRARSIHRHRDW